MCFIGRPAGSLSLSLFVSFQSLLFPLSVSEMSACLSNKRMYNY